MDPLLPDALGLPRTVIIGGGGCRKTTTMQKVAVSTLLALFKHVVLAAPSNRAARGFHPGAKTMRSLAGITPADSTRTSVLNIKGGDMRRRMDANQMRAGVCVHDEALQTSAPLPHAAALCAACARQCVYGLRTRRNSRQSELFGRISALIMCGDRLQLPPVPKSSGLLAPLEGTRDEPKVGAAMLNKVKYLFEMHAMMRFTDDILISILKKTHASGGAKLSAEWNALKATAIDEDRLAQDPGAILRGTKGWFESC